jgi:DNA-binding IclR family transcriptional regulator
MNLEKSDNGAIPGTAALAKGISVLNAIADCDEPPIFSQLQTATSLPKGTLHRILKALILEGLVRYEHRSKTYHLGLRLLSLAYQVLEDMDIRDIARSELVRLRDLTGEAIHLAVRDNLKAVYIDIIESTQAVASVAKIGSHSELHNTAVGKVIVASLPPDEQAEVIGSLAMTGSTPATITSQRKLKAQLEDVRQRGYAINEEEELIGIHGIAAPVYGHHGEVVAAICITIPSYRFDKSKLSFYVTEVVSTANAISRRMGRSPR